jgi:hypothetical protein
MRSRARPSTFTLSSTASPASGTNVVCSIGPNRRSPELVFFYRRLPRQESAFFGPPNARKNPRRNSELTQFSRAPKPEGRDPDSWPYPESFSLDLSWLYPEPSAESREKAA